LFSLALKECKTTRATSELLGVHQSTVVRKMRRSRGEISKIH
jgi:hypothetical protein